MSQSVSKHIKFTVPENFTEEEITGDCFFEDVDNDDLEIWFMQAPADVDPSRLDHQTLNLEGVTQLSYDEDKMLECTATAYAPNQANPYNLILPQKNTKQLTCVKKEFSGFLIVKERVNVPKYECPESIDQCRSDKPKQLIQRHRPFGRKKIIANNKRKHEEVSPHKKRKKQKFKEKEFVNMQLDEQVAEDVNNDPSQSLNSEEKQKDRRKKHKVRTLENDSMPHADLEAKELDYRDLHISVEDTDQGFSQATSKEVSPHKKKKKRKDKEKEFIDMQLDDQVADNVNGDPRQKLNSEENQEYKKKKHKVRISEIDIKPDVDLEVNTNDSERLLVNIKHKKKKSKDKIPFGYFERTD